MSRTRTIKGSTSSGAKRLNLTWGNGRWGGCLALKRRRPARPAAPRQRRALRKARREARLAAFVAAWHCVGARLQLPIRFGLFSIAKSRRRTPLPARGNAPPVASMRFLAALPAFWDGRITPSPPRGSGVCRWARCGQEPHRRFLAALTGGDDLDRRRRRSDAIP